LSQVAGNTARSFASYIALNLWLGAFICQSLVRPCRDVWKRLRMLEDDDDDDDDDADADDEEEEEVVEENSTP